MYFHFVLSTKKSNYRTPWGDTIEANQALTDKPFEDRIICRRQCRASKDKRTKCGIHFTKPFEEKDLGRWTCIMTDQNGKKSYQGTRIT